MSATHIALEMVKGNVGPKYTDTVELQCSKVVVTEQGMQSGLPFVDLVCADPAGNQYLVVLSGRIINMISAAVRGANFRNHGVDEP